MMSDAQHALYSFLLATPLVPWVMLTILFSVIEYAFHDAKAPPLASNRILNAACGFVVCTFAFITMPFLEMVIGIVTRHFGNGLIPVHPFSHHSTLNLISEVAIFLFVRDFFFYLWHRTEHKVVLLWDIHAVHHSDRKLNSTSYMRQNWIDLILQGIFVNIPVVLLLSISPEALFDSYLISAAWNFFGHSSLRLNLGIFTPILTGPQLHRLHHSLLPQHWDKNFAQFFPVWDILFGTYVPPEHNEFPPTGLASEDTIETLNLMISWPLKRWLRYLTT